MLRFGLPDKILHDHGGEFENDLFKELAKLRRVKSIRTTPYHPQTNRKVERMNQTIISMLQTLPELQKSKWKDHIQKLVFAYNCTKHSRTGYFLVDTRTPNRHYTTNRLPSKRNPQRLHQRMERTNERCLQNGIKAREE